MSNHFYKYTHAHPILSTSKKLDRLDIEIHKVDY
jgi:hypothetical protein